MCEIIIHNLLFCTNFSANKTVNDIRNHLC